MPLAEELARLGYLGRFDALGAMGFIKAVTGWKRFAALVGVWLFASVSMIVAVAHPRSWSVVAVATLGVAFAFAALCMPGRLGVYAVHLRIAGASAVGALVLCGLKDQLKPLLGASAGTRSIVCGLALLAILTYLFFEAVGVSGRLRVGPAPIREIITNVLYVTVVIGIPWAGLAGLVSATVVFSPHGTSGVSLTGAGVASGQVWVLATLTLALGVLSQLFWQDATIVDPL